jgi:hypothetical protein
VCTLPCSSAPPPTFALTALDTLRPLPAEASTASVHYQEATSRLHTGAAAAAAGRRGGFGDGGGVFVDGELPAVPPEAVHSERELRDRMEQVGGPRPGCCCASQLACTGGMARRWPVQHSRRGQRLTAVPLLGPPAARRSAP